MTYFDVGDLGLEDMGYWSLSDMLEANADDAELCEWAKTAQPGDIWTGGGEHCECVAIA